MKKTDSLSGYAITMRDAVKLKPGDALPGRFIVMPWGTHETRYGKRTVNERTLEVFEAYQRARRIDSVMGDINHASMPGAVPRGTPVKKMAKGKASVQRGVGIVWEIEPEGYWTAEGKELVGGGHYPDLSPALWSDENGVVLGLHSVAFCEHGEISAPELEIFAADSGAENPNEKPKDTMTKTLLMKLLALMGVTVPEDATDEQIAGAVAQAEANAKAAGAAGAAPPPEGMSAELRGMINGFQAQLTALSAEYDKLKKDNAVREVRGLIAAAVAAGKKVGLDEATLVGFGAENAAKYLDSLEAGAVPLHGNASNSNNNANGANGGGSSGGGKDELHGFSAEEAAILRNAGTDLKEAAYVRDNGRLPEPATV